MNKFLNNNMNKIIKWFLILSPIFDLITSLSINIFKINFNYIIIFKICFMFLLIYYLIFISKNKYKKYSLIYLFILFMYVILYMCINISIKDISVLTYELQNIIRTIYFPICLICLFNYYKENTFNVDYKLLGKILVIYLLLILIPIITHTGFDSYAYSKVGTIGWFNSTNEIGGILSILYPFLLMLILNYKNKILTIFVIIITIYIYFSLGSKVPVLSLSIIFILYIIKYLIQLFENKLYKKISILISILIACIVSGIILIPKTSFYKNIIIHLDFLEINEVSDLFTIENIDHFIFSSRIKFMDETMNNYSKSSLKEKIFGIGYIENYGTDLVNTKTIEMDYYDIFFRNGIVGFIVILLPFFYILIEIIKKLKTIKINNINFNLLISIFLIIILSLFSGHIITAPSVSLFCSMIFVYFLNINKEAL